MNDVQVTAAQHFVGALVKRIEPLNPRGPNVQYAKNELDKIVALLNSEVAHEILRLQGLMRSLEAIVNVAVRTNPLAALKDYSNDGLRTVSELRAELAQVMKAEPTH